MSSVHPPPPEDSAPQDPLTGDSRHLRVFFSVDVSGSTKYKNQHTYRDGYDQPWTSFYDNFFRDFTHKVLARVREPSEWQPTPATDFSVWKLLGDEILFTASLSSAEEAFHLTRRFYEVLCELDDDYHREKYFLRLKGTAWTAGFPVRNYVIPKDITRTGISDYIGPDMDIGFRLCKLTKPGRLAVSHDLADILAGDNGHAPFNFFLVGWRAMPGVFDDKPYPVIWITTGKPTNILPWEGLECELTHKFETDAEISPKDLQAKITAVRKALPMLKLVPPYFEEMDMPEEHKRVWANRKENLASVEGVGTMEMGSDEAL